MVTVAQPYFSSISHSFLAVLRALVFLISTILDQNLESLKSICWPLRLSIFRSVYRPCLTGLGEKVHLSSPGIGLQTHILDVVNNILYEDINDIILIGHSYGGMVITGVADSIPQRIKKMIYLDAVIPNNGKNLLSVYGDDEKEAKSWFENNLKDGFIYLDSENFKKYTLPKMKVILTKHLPIL